MSAASQLRGQLCIARPTIRQQVVERLVGRSPSPGRTRNRSARSPAARIRPRAITPRQRQVLRLVAEGLGNKEIAARLKVTSSGAKKHLEALTRRYSVSGRTALVRAAIQAGDLRIGKGRTAL